MLIKKRYFYHWALSNGYPVPKCWNYEEINNIDEDDFPIVVKPEYRRISSNSEFTKKISDKMDRMRLTVIRDKSQLDKFVERNKDLLGYFLFLEYVEGLSDRMYTIGIYADQNYDVKGMFTGRKVRGFPPDIGDCIVGQAEYIPTTYKKLVINMCKEIKYHGIAEFEFKKDATTGDFKLIEINPRSWSWIGITPACGVSLPWIAYADLTRMDTFNYSERIIETGSVKWARVLDDFVNCIYLNKQAGYPEWHMNVKSWLASLRSDRIVIAEFANFDLIPSVFSLYIVAKKILSKMLNLKK